MSHLLYLMFRCDGDVMESVVFVGVFGGSKRGLTKLFAWMGCKSRDESNEPT